MFCLLYSPKQKIVKFHAQKQIGKSHVIDIFTSEDMENISLCIFQYLILYYIINGHIMSKPDFGMYMSGLSEYACEHTEFLYVLYMSLFFTRLGFLCS
jgi:hypothetical protein